MATNNCEIIDHNLLTIVGGDTITPGEHFDSYCSKNSNYSSSYASLFLPDFTTDTVVYLLHKDKEFIPERGIVLAFHLYLEIIVKRKEDSYYVKEKVIIANGEYMVSFLHAVPNKSMDKW